MTRGKKDGFQVNIVTSDITYMKETYCVAGWNPSTRQMRRLLINGKHWDDNDLKRIGRYASLLVTVIPTERYRDFPHRTEDIWISNDFRVIKTYDAPKKLAKDLKGSISPTIQRAFQGQLQDNAYIPAGTKCPSLGAIIIPSKNIEFFRIMISCGYVSLIMTKPNTVCVSLANICVTCWTR